MALPVVVTYQLGTGTATSVINVAGPTSAGVAFTLGSTSFNNQRRVTFTTAADESANTFVIVGTNQAGFTITENLAGPNASTTQSNLDFKTLVSIKPLVTTQGTVSAGLGPGSSLWNIVNWHVTPVNIEMGTVLQSGLATWSIQYTYDDPNNLPSGVAFPQPYNHPTIVNATTSIDGSINDPITAWRILINLGGGTVRAIGIQAGIGGP